MLWQEKRAPPVGGRRKTLHESDSLSTFHPYLYTSTIKKVTGPVTHKQNRTFIQVFMYLSLACHPKIKEPDHSDGLQASEVMKRKDLKKH